MNRICMLTMFLFLLVSCGNRNAGKEQRETTASLEKQGASVETFAADYRPPAGIKYQPTIVRTGAKTINVAAALNDSAHSIVNILIFIVYKFNYSLC